MKIPAFQVSENDLRDILPPESKPGCIVIVPYLFQFLKMGFDFYFISTNKVPAKMAGTLSAA